jgi:CHASE2 domain-containing sensor protein
MPFFIHRLCRAGSPLISVFREHSLSYWITAVVILFLTIWMAPFIDLYVNLEPVRNWLFQNLAQSVTNPAAGQHVKLVIIRDDEFWDGELHHRIPLDRTYLARLVRALDVADASVIAIDLDVRLPHPTGVVKPGDYSAVDSFSQYRDETAELIHAIDEVAGRRNIVLSKTIDGPIDGPFQLLNDIYQPYGICIKLTGDGRWDNPGTPEFPIGPEAQQNIACGYVALMVDKRRVPPPVKIAGQVGVLDSFALAIVRARYPTPELGDRWYYATYVSPTQIKDEHTTVSAHELLANPKAASRILRGFPVIIGGGWNQRAAGSGFVVDLHDTPIGKTNGALIHANLAEAVLGNRIFPAFPNTFLKGLEFLVGVVAALAFAAFRSLWQKVSAIIISMLTLCLLQWLTLQLFGAFLDAFYLLFALGLHAIVDRLVGEQTQSGQLRRLGTTAGGTASGN